MILVTDANVFLAAMIRNGKTRELFLDEKLQLYAPEFLFDEFLKHIDVVSHKSEISKDRIESLARRLFEIADIQVFASPELSPHMAAAKALTPDPNDKDYFALALKLDRPIWSNDKKLKEQSRVKVYSTSELIRLLG